MSRLLTLHDPAEAAVYYQAGLWRSDTLYGLAVKHAQERGDAYALRDPYRRLTWRELVAEADQVAGDLHAAGIRAGERVSIWMSNRVEAVIVFLACSRNGYVYNTSLHQSYTVAEIRTLLERVSCRALFAQIDYGADGRKKASSSRHWPCRQCARCSPCPLVGLIPRCRQAPMPSPMPAHRSRPSAATIPMPWSISPSPRARPARPRA
jgi:acyl-CoA synthetase